MKRKEEILQAADNYKAHFPDGYIKEYVYIDAAEWADRTMIERACEFIKKRFTETIVGNVISKHETTINEVINDLREYMKGELSYDK